jgi:hypothetical protein
VNENSSNDFISKITDTSAVILATDDEKQLKANIKSVMLKRLNPEPDEFEDDEFKEDNKALNDQGKGTKYFFVLLKLFIFKLFRLGFNLFNITKQLPRFLQACLYC